MNQLEDLKILYKTPGKHVATAHRGFSGKYPENTLIAFSKAVELGVDIVEFDVRMTKDGIPVILHDKTLDRTTNGSGKPEDFSLKEIKELNASFWQGPHNTGKRLETPACSNAKIPTLEEALNLLSGKVCINIQVYTKSFDKVIEQYNGFNLYEQAYLMLGTFEDAKLCKSIDERVHICVGEDRGNLERHRDFGLTFIQPPRNLITPEFCKKIEELDLCANMFFSNTAEDNLHFLQCGIKGIMTDNPDILLESFKEFEN